MWGWIVWSVITLIGIILLVIYRLSRADPRPFIMPEDAYKGHVAGAVFATLTCLAAVLILFVDIGKLHFLWVFFLMAFFSVLVTYIRIPLISPSILWLAKQVTGVKENGSLSHLLIIDAGKHDFGSIQTGLLPNPQIYPQNSQTIGTETKELKNCRKEAEEGNISAQCAMGICLAEGNGIKQDFQESLMWYSLAAETGNPTAQYNLGIFYMMGPAGVDQNLIEAAKWFRKSAEAGIAIAQYRLGFMYANGAGVPKDEEEAKRRIKMVQKIRRLRT